MPGAPRASRKPLAAFLVLALAAIGVVAFIAFGTSAGAANLRLVFTRGETHRYALDISMDFRGGTLKAGQTFIGGLSGVMRQRTSAVDPDGVATIEYGFENLKLTEGGRTRTIPTPVEVTTMRIAPDGEVLDVDGPGLSALGNINPAASLVRPEIFGPQLPGNEVSAGDSWGIDERFANDLGDDFHVTGTGTLVEKSTIGNEESAVIRTVVNSPLNFDFSKIGGTAGIPAGVSMAFDGFLSMDITNSMGMTSGRLHSALGELKMTGTFTFSGVPQIGTLSGVMNMSVQITMTELPAAV